MVKCGMGKTPALGVTTAESLDYRTQNPMQKLVTHGERVFKLLRALENPCMACED